MENTKSTSSYLGGAQGSSPSAPGRSRGSLWGFGTLFSSSLGYYRALLPRVIILLLVPLILSIINTALGIAGAPLVLSGFSGLLAALVSLFFTGFLIPVVSLIIVDQLYTRKPVLAPDQFFKAAFPFLTPFALTTLLSTVVTLGGFVLFIIPGIVVSIWLSMIMYVVILENRRGYDALLRSAGLVLGSSWGVASRMLGFALGIFLLYGVLVGIPFLILSFSVFGSGVQGFFTGAFPQGGEIPPRLKMISSLVSLWQTSLDLFILPFFISYFYLLYRNLRELKGDTVAHEKKTFFSVLTVLAIVGVVLMFFLFAFLLAWYRSVLTF